MSRAIEARHASRASSRTAEHIIRTEGVDERKVDSGTASRPAAPVEQRLRIEGGGPAGEVYPAASEGEEAEEIHVALCVSCTSEMAAR